MYSSSICLSSFRTLPVYSVLRKNVKTKRHKIFTEPEVILDIESDAHVGGLPLYVELVARLRAGQKRVELY